MDKVIEKHGCVLFGLEGEKIVEKKGMQKIEVLSTCMGKVLVIDGKIQLSEKDESFYHEMLVHVPLLMHPNPEKVLIIGGGDGGAAREVLKHHPKRVVLVEIDKDVIEICRRYISIDKGALERVEIVLKEGLDFVSNCNEKFDVVIVDGSDPDALSKPLISKKFYRECFKICDLLVTQSQSPYLQKDYFLAILKNSECFPHRAVYLSFVPTYPSGMWSFLLCSKKPLVLNKEEIVERFKKREIETIYYTPELHLASFAMPKWLKEILNQSLQA